MRISDWSSDVCSSDLPGYRPRPLAGVAPWLGGADRAGFGQSARRRRRQHAARHRGRLRKAAERRESASGRLTRQDRKSVGSGKSVSVRVDLGGPRIIIKKTDKLEKTPDEQQDK